MKETNYMNVYHPPGLNRDSNPDLCDGSAVLYQLSYQANWELVIVWIDDKPLDDGYRSILMYEIHE